MQVRMKPNKIEAVLKVRAAGEFYDDEATEETLRYAVEQDLEDAGFEVDVSVLKKPKPKKYVENYPLNLCPKCGASLYLKQPFCDRCGQEVAWE